MSNEKEIRENFKDIVKSNYSDILVIDEFCGGDMKTRADLALIQPNKLFMVEIKSDKDNLDRLPHQIIDYLKYSHLVFVILDIKHKDKYFNLVDKNSLLKSWYVYTYFYDNGFEKDFTKNLDYVINYNFQLHKIKIFDLLWSKEKDQFVNFLKGRTKVNRDKIIKHIYTINELSSLSNYCLYDRVSKNINKPRKFGKDLPEIGNIPEINYKEYKQIMLNDLIKDINGDK